MAKSLTKTTTRTRKPKAEAEAKVEEPKIQNISVRADADAVEEAIKAQTVRKYNDDDLIPCRSITTGELLVEGQKSKALYRWADYGYVEYMEYRDLLYDIRSASNSFSNKPCFIIEDEELVSKFPKLEAVYASLYSMGDFAELLAQDVSTIKRVAEFFPKGAKESFKSYVATQIRNGNLDSMNRIRALDEIFGTQMATLLFPG